MQKLLYSLFLTFVVNLVGPLAIYGQSIDLSGEWDTSYGLLRLSAISDGFQGPYETDNGQLRLIYTVDGTYEGEWSEGSSAQRCSEPSSLGGSYHWGKLKGEVPNQRESFTLSWSYCDSEDYSNSWTFTPKIGAQESVEDHPKIEGNWFVEWGDSDEPPAIVSVFSEYRWDCANPEDSWCQKRITGPLVLSAGQPTISDDAHPSGKVSQSDGKLQVKWGYWHFGRWGGESSLRASSNNRLEGEWSGAGLDGPEVWQRATSQVSSVVAISKLHDDFWPGPRKALGQPVRLIAPYLSETYSMRGNRESVFLDLYGSNMWGHHEYLLSRDTGVEITGSFYICADAQIVSQSIRNASCLEAGGVVGMRLELMPWPAATPGLKYLRFDGQSIPFALEFSDYPTPFVVESPDTQVSRVVLLDDQLGQRREPGDSAKSYAYPFDRSGRPTGGVDTRLLAVIGRNIDLDGETYVASADPKISYRRISLPENIQRAINNAAISLSGHTLEDGEQIVAVRATLSNGVQGGIKRISVNGSQNGWPLAFAGIGEARFLRVGTTPNDTPASVFYVGETVRLGVRANDDNFPNDNLRYSLEAVIVESADSEPRVRRIGPVSLRRTEDRQRGQNFAVSDPLLLTKADAPALAASEGEQTIELRAGERLIARPIEPLALITFPPIVQAEIIGSPRRSRLWLEALNRVSACPGLGGDATNREFANETSKVYSNWILTEGGTRRITVTKGDHAALILIRDDLLPVMEAANNALLEYIAGGDEGRSLAQRYWSAAKANPRARSNAFWTGRKHVIVQEQILAGRRVSRETEVTLSETFNVDALREKVKMKNRVETQDLINFVVAKNLKDQHTDTKAAVLRARRAYDCKIDDLLAISGRAAPASFRTLMPDLMVEENGRWRPDVQARGHVRTAHVLGQAIRDQTQYAQIDNAYKSMALALAALPASALGAGLATSGNTALATLGSASAWAALGADAVDLAFFGLQGVEEYRDGEKDYLTLLGLAPFVEVDLLEEARRQRTSAAAAAVGVIAPVLSGGVAISALDDIGKINRGRALMRDENGLQRLDELSDSQRTDIAAYYRNLNEIEASKTTKLTAFEEADFRAFKELESGAAPRVDLDASATDSFLDLNIGGPPRGQSMVDPEIPVRVSAKQEAAAPSGSAIEIPPSNGAAVDEFRVAETAMDAEDIWKLGPNERFTHPYRSKFATGDGESGGTLLTDVPTGGATLPDEGAEIVLNNGDTLRIGKKVGQGGFRRVYSDPEDGSAVYKVASYQDAWRKNEMLPEDLDRFFHDTDVGRELLTAMSKESSDGLFKVAGQRGPPIVVDDPFHAGRKFVITREDNIASTVAVRRADGSTAQETVTNAAERFALRPSGKANDAERLTVQLTLRKLNQEGIVWTDNKLTNLDVIVDQTSPTGYKVVFFDYDGFRIAKGATRHQRYANARQTQQVFSTLKKGDNLTFKLLNKDLPDFDHTIFGTRMGTPRTIDPYKKFPAFTRLDTLSPKEFGAVVKQFETATGRKVPYRPPPPPTPN